MTKSYIDNNGYKPAKHNPIPGSLCFHGRVATWRDLPTEGDWGDGCVFYVDDPGDNYVFNGGKWERFARPAQPTIIDIVAQSHDCALRKGWWEDENGVPARVNDKVMEKLCLIHSEVSEATEDFRNGNMELTYDKSGLNKPEWFSPEMDTTNVGGKPCGFPSELADILIRVADLAGALGIDLNKALLEKMAYNETRPYRHGGKKA